MKDIEHIASKPTKVMLFRHVKHLRRPVEFDWIKKNRILDGNILTIRAINDEAFRKICNYGE
jgi:hypothetical protein